MEERRERSFEGEPQRQVELRVTGLDSDIPARINPPTNRVGPPKVTESTFSEKVIDEVKSTPVDVRSANSASSPPELEEQMIAIIERNNTGGE